MRRHHQRQFTNLIYMQMHCWLETPLGPPAGFGWGGGEGRGIKDRKTGEGDREKGEWKA